MHLPPLGDNFLFGSIAGLADHWIATCPLFVVGELPPGYIASLEPVAAKVAAEVFAILATRPRALGVFGRDDEGLAIGKAHGKENLLTSYSQGYVQSRSSIQRRRLFRGGRCLQCS